MIDPIAIGQTKDFITKAERAAPAVKEVKDAKGNVTTPAQPARAAAINPTIWIIGALDSIEKAQILSSLGDKEVNEKMSSQMMVFEIVKYGLKGFKNFGTLKFATETIKSMDKEREVVPMDIIRRIPFILVNELAAEIWGENLITETEEKN